MASWAGTKVMGSRHGTYQEGERAATPVHCTGSRRTAASVETQATPKDRTNLDDLRHRLAWLSICGSDCWTYATLGHADERARVKGRGVLRSTRPGRPVADRVRGWSAKVRARVVRHR